MSCLHAHILDVHLKINIDNNAEKLNPIEMDGVVKEIYERHAYLKSDKHTVKFILAYNFSSSFYDHKSPIFE